MDERHRTILRKSRVIFIKDLSEITAVCDQLFCFGILTDGMKSEILLQTGRESQARTLLDILPRRGKEAYGNFHQALIDTHQQELADILQPELAAKPLMKSKTVQEEPMRYEKSPLTRSLSTPEPNYSTNLSFPGDESVGNQGITQRNLDVTQRNLDITPRNLDVMERNLDVTGRNLDITNERIPDFFPETVQPLKVEIKKCDRRKIMEKNESIYSMESNPRGKVIIINNFKFECDTKIPLRDQQCHEISATSMNVLFRELKFHVSTHTNVTTKEFQEIIRQEQSSQHSYDCFVMIILSHGFEDLIFTVDGEPLKIENIIGQFDAEKCPGLEGKPKLFFIHACPSDCDQALASQDPFSLGKLTNDGTDEHQLTKADIFIARATTYDPIQFAEESKGFWFFQAFSHIMQYYSPDHHLLDIMTKVKGLATEDRQLIETIDTLRKMLYFFP